MIFKAKIFSGKFKCSIKGIGNVKVIVNDKFITSLSLPNEIYIRSEEYKNDSNVYKIQIENIDSKDVKIGPVRKGEILEIESWGDLDIVRLYKLFENNDNEILKLPDYIPKSLTDLSYLFYGTRSRHIEGIESWDVSHVRNVSFMFSGAVNFDQDISKWNTSSVTNMSFMFSGAENFNQDLSSWDVSSITDMSHMFYKAKSFNQDLSSWNVSSVTDMRGMFRGAENFNRDISKWDTSSVTDMSWMFAGAEKFNRDISKWDTSSVKDMSYMFAGAESFNGDVSNWKVSSVMDTSRMFQDAKSFNFNIPNFVDIILRNIESSED